MKRSQKQKVDSLISSFFNTLVGADAQFPQPAPEITVESTFEDEKNDYLKFQQRGDDTERFIGKRESKKENECEIGVNSLDLDWLVEEPPPLSMSMSKELKLKSYNGRKQHQ